jgi:4'-phosphopantetheinyl transferase EntD
MPLVYQQNINASTKIGVWHLAESEAFFSERIRIQQHIAHPHKRLQHLAGRWVLTELFPEFPVSEVRIAASRKPYLPEKEFQFSISHCGDYAAAIVSMVNKVGIDIEIPQIKIEPMRHKFLSDEEQVLLLQHPYPSIQLLTIAWSIKEAIFKWYADGKVDFKAHIQILEVDITDDQFVVICNFTKHDPIKLVVNGIFFNGNCLSWLATG